MGLKQLVKCVASTLRGMLAGARLGRGVYIGSRVRITNGGRLVLGNDVQIRPDVDLFAGEGGLMIGSRCDIGERCRLCGDIVLGEAVLFGPDSYVSSKDHRYEDVSRAVMDQGTYAPRKNGHDELSVGEGSWVGTHCSIIGDVHIGKHCVIGSNSVVTHDVADYCVVAGSPARVLKQWNAETSRWVCGAR